MGVPQGSVLAPILFMLFINDVSQHIYLGTCNLYADDCLIYCTGKNVDDVRENLQKCIDNVKDWYEGNCLELNVSKCNSMLIRSKHMISQLNDNDALNIIMGNSIVTQVDVAKYLGVTLEQSLSWDHHVNDICCKLSKKVGQLSRIRKSTPNDILYTIDYCLTIWGNTNACNLKKNTKLTC